MQDKHPLARGIAPEQAAIAERVLSAEARPGAADNGKLATEWTNDLGNARRLIARHGGDLAYVEEIGWLAWDGKRWHADGGDAQAWIRAQMTAEAILEECETFPAFNEPEPDKIDKPAHKEWSQRMRRALAPMWDLKKWALESGNSGRASSMLKAAEPHLRMSQKDLDADPYVLNVLNGTIELKKTRALYPHRRSDWITKIGNVTYDVEASCDRWERFISEILPEATGEGRGRFFQKVLGYSMSGDTTWQKVLYCEGKGANGKSTALEVVAHILGDYAVTAPIATFLHKQHLSGSGPSPDIAKLAGARLVRTSEPRAGDRIDESILKQWTGGEKMTARRLQKDFFEFTPEGKLILSMNIRPVLAGKDHGTRRRILVLPFKERFDVGAGAKRGDTLVRELLDEAPGILNWLIEGFALWMEEGLEPPVSVQEATDAYFSEQDPIGAFVAAAFTPTEQEHDKIGASDAFAAYQRWCHDNNEDAKTATAFGRRLGDLGYKRQRSSGGIFYTGVTLDPAWRAAATRGQNEGNEP